MAEIDAPSPVSKSGNSKEKPGKSESKSDNAGFKKGRWQQSEVDLLKQNAREYLEQHCLTLAGVMALPVKEKRTFFKHCGLNISRPYINIWKKCHRIFDAKNNIGTYTETECKTLMKLANRIADDNPTKWKDLGDKLGRSAASVRDRVTKVGAKKNSTKKQFWTKEEKEKFKKARQEHGDNWKLISVIVGTRTARQCLKYELDKKRNGRGEKLSLSDQVKMIELLSREPVHYIQDINWSKLSDSWAPEDRNPSINPSNLCKRFKLLIHYHIPLQNQLSFSDVIDLLMTHFVKPFREGKVHPVNGRQIDENYSIKERTDEQCVMEIDDDDDDHTVNEEDGIVGKSFDDYDDDFCGDLKSEIKMEQFIPAEDCIA